MIFSFILFRFFVDAIDDPIRGHDLDLTAMLHSTFIFGLKMNSEYYNQPQ